MKDKERELLDMNKELLEAVTSHDMEAVCRYMLPPRRFYGGGSQEQEIDFNREALDVENFLINIDVWMDNLLEFDEYTDQYNKDIMEFEDYKGSLDYILFEKVLAQKYDLEEKFGGYTYNDPDNCRLNRDIHYTVFRNEENEEYVIFNIHYGADARIGFSDAVVFKLSDSDYFFIGMEISAYVESTDEDLEWYQVEDIASYDEDCDAWVLNDTGEEVMLHTSADGF